MPARRAGEQFAVCIRSISSCCFFLMDRKWFLSPALKIKARTGSWQVSIPGLVLGCRGFSWVTQFLWRAGGHKASRHYNSDFAHRRLALPGVAAGPESLSPLQPAGVQEPPSRHLPSNAACLTCFAVARENKVLLFHFAGRKRSH